MDISFKQLGRLVDFLDKIEAETYPENPELGHAIITKQVINYLADTYPFVPNARILDVGCGQGPALEHFRSMGLDAIGITLNDEDVKICIEKGFNVRKMDQSFLEYGDSTFDCIWARHVLEHSIFPLFTLNEFKRVLKKGALMYLEIPAPDTACHHESNVNHYSVLTLSGWRALLAKSGFEILEEAVYQFQSLKGPDEYWGLYCRKEGM